MLAKESKWSKAVYYYQLAAYGITLNQLDAGSVSIGKISEWMKKVGDNKKKIAGKVHFFLYSFFSHHASSTSHLQDGQRRVFHWKSL